MSNCVLVLNCGSSSLKFAIVQLPSGERLLEGLAERLFTPEAIIKFKVPQKETISVPEAGHQIAIAEILKRVNADQIIGIGHRVVHGGEYFKESALINDDTLAKIDACSSLAPLHNPANIQGIKSAAEAFPGKPQTATFDTAFHATMPETSYIYAVPYHLYKDHGIRRYGMHGTSHLIVSERGAEAIGKPISDLNLIVAHLGNGCSVTAIKGGKSVDTSMGLTPLEGLVMGTRSGDVDPGLIGHVCSKFGWTAAEAIKMLNNESGLLGISGLSNDCRTLEEAYAEGHAGATLAMEIFCYRLAKYIASLCVPLGSLDGLMFTGGIGENSDIIRAKVIGLLPFLGLTVDNEANLAARFGKDGRIDAGTGPQVHVIPTDEELVIARDAAALIGAA